MNDIEMLITFAIGISFASLALGHLWGTIVTNKAWTICADEKYRTAVCCDGKFFYVIPEKDYVALQIKAQRFDQMEET